MVSFERMVGIVQRPLEKVLGNAKLTYVKLLTILLEIEGTLHSCPLTYEYDGVGGEMLTPPHLLMGSGYYHSQLPFPGRASRA